MTNTQMYEITFAVEVAWM